MATHGATRDDTRERSVGELVQQLSAQTSALVRQELELAQLEMRAKGRRAGRGAGLMGGAGLLAFYGGAALIATAILGLSEAIEPWLAALVVTAVLLVVAGLLALVGRTQVRRAAPIAPEQAMRTAKESLDTVRGRARNA